MKELLVPLGCMVLVFACLRARAGVAVAAPFAMVGWLIGSAGLLIGHELATYEPLIKSGLLGLAAIGMLLLGRWFGRDRKK